MSNVESRKPKIRFKGFTDPWEQRKLGELCAKFVDGDWIEVKDQSASGIRLIQTGNIGKSVFLNKNERSKFISVETFSQLKCTEVLPGDILISRLPEPAGRACIVPELGQRTITAVDCTIARVDRGYSNRFLVQMLSSDNYFAQIEQLLGGGTRQRVTRSALSKISFMIPSDAEQQQIGHYFARLDALITLHQREPRFADTG